MTPREPVSSPVPIANVDVNVDVDVVVDVVVDGVLDREQEAFHRAHAPDPVLTGRLAHGLECLAL